MMDVNDEVVIIGAGICGLATALALHRKGIKSVVMERSETLRNTTGAAFGIRRNGWRALEQLGVADILRRTAIPIKRERIISLADGTQQEIPIDSETRCVRRKDLIDSLYNSLPSTTVKFGRKLESIEMDPITTKPRLQFIDGSSIIVKVVIGCDGSKSVVANFLNLQPTKMFPLCEIKGLTNYPNGHSFDHEFCRFIKGNILVGRMPVDDHLVYYFCTQPYIPKDERIWKDPEVIRRSTLELLHDYPQEVQEMIESADAKSLSFIKLRYHAPWDLLMETFCKGTVTVAGDAMHVMGPFLGQGGSAGLEDAIVLARNLGQTGLSRVGSDIKLKVEEAFNLFSKQRRMRVVRLSLQAYLIGMLSAASSRLKRFLYNVLLVVLFRNPSGHINYDCGDL